MLRRYLNIVKCNVVYTSNCFLDNLTHKLLMEPTAVFPSSHFMFHSGHVARMGEERNVYKVLVGKP
jgi:hypothetical protein